MFIHEHPFVLDILIFYIHMNLYLTCLCYLAIIALPFYHMSICFGYLLSHPFTFEASYSFNTYECLEQIPPHTLTIYVIFTLYILSI